MYKMEIVRKRLYVENVASFIAWSMFRNCDRDVEKRHRLKMMKIRCGMPGKENFRRCFYPLYFHKKVLRFIPFCIFFCCLTKPEICKGLLYASSYIKREEEDCFSFFYKEEQANFGAQVVILCFVHHLHSKHPFT